MMTEGLPFFSFIGGSSFYESNGTVYGFVRTAVAESGVQVCCICSFDFSSKNL